MPSTGSTTQPGTCAAAASAPYSSPTTGTSGNSAASTRRVWRSRVRSVSVTQSNGYLACGARRSRSSRRRGDHLGGVVGQPPGHLESPREQARLDRRRRGAGVLVVSLLDGVMRPECPRCPVSPPRPADDVPWITSDQHSCSSCPEYTLLAQRSVDAPTGRPEPAAALVAHGHGRASRDRLGMLPPRGQRRHQLGAAGRRAPHGRRARGARRRARHGRAEQYHGRPVVRIPALDLPVVISMPVGVPSRRVLTALREFRPDVVHLAAPFVVGYRGLAAARRLGMPTVAVYQTDVAGFASSYGLGLTARAAWRWTLPPAHAGRPHAGPVDAGRRRRCARAGVPRVHQWARGVDTSRFTPSQAATRGCARGWRPTASCSSATSAGWPRRSRSSGWRRCAACPGCGSSSWATGRAGRALQAALPDAAFLGFRDGDELARMYASLDVFVHTGPAETFCQAVQEALASGVPVVAPDAGGPRDLVLPGRTGYLVPPRPDGARRVGPGVRWLRTRAARRRRGAGADPAAAPQVRRGRAPVRTAPHLVRGLRRARRALRGGARRSRTVTSRAA